MPTLGGPTQNAMIYDMRGHAFDADGEEMIGWYCQLIDDDERPISDLDGPYGSYSEALEACQRTYNQHDY